MLLQLTTMSDPLPPDVQDLLSSHHGELLAEKKRESQCSFRRAGCCDIVNATLGWRHGMPLDHCDRCWNAGGPENGGGPVRDSIAMAYRDFALANIRSANREIITVLLRDHMTPEEVQAFRNDPEYNWIVSRESRWAMVSSSWDLAESFVRSVASRGFTGRRVDLTVKGRRHVSCTGTTLEGVRVSDPCPALVSSQKNPGSSYCNECRCGDRSIAWITKPQTDPTSVTKLDFPFLECPRGRPGFSNEGQMPFESLVDATGLVLPPPRP